MRFSEAIDGVNSVGRAMDGLNFLGLLGDEDVFSFGDLEDPVSCIGTAWTICSLSSNCDGSVIVAWTAAWLSPVSS